MTKNVKILAQKEKYKKVLGIHFYSFYLTQTVKESQNICI